MTELYKFCPACMWAVVNPRPTTTNCINCSEKLEPMESFNPDDYYPPHIIIAPTEQPPPSSIDEATVFPSPIKPYLDEPEPPQAA